VTRTFSTRAVRVVAGLVFVASALTALTLVMADRERKGLPVAAHELLQASLQAAQVSSCLDGVSDDVEGAGQQLRTCDLSGLARAIDEVSLPMQAPLSTSVRRQARAAIVAGVADLRRALADARAHRAPDAAADASYAKAELALALLGEPQSSVVGG
jgi:hypothetical protein